MKRIVCHITLALMALTAVAQRINIEPVNLFGVSSTVNPYVADSVLYFASDAKTDVLVNYFDQNDDRLFRLYYVNLRNKKPRGFSHVYLSKRYVTENEIAMVFDAEGRPIVTQNNRAVKNSKGQNTLGLFLYDSEDDSHPQTLIDPTGAYNITYASVSPDGQFMVFASDEESDDAFGRNDLYICDRKGSGWGPPRNMGSTINTGGNEIAPFVHSSGKIFFSSNGREDSRKLDLYYTYRKGDSFTTPVRFEGVVNSIADDYGFFFSENEEWGYITSNRHGTDQLYFFQIEFPRFGPGKQLEAENYCYTFFEESTGQYDPKEFEFRWKFSDGGEVAGAEAKHCFAGPGGYDVELSVYDKTTKEEMFSIASYHVDLERPEQLILMYPEEIRKGEYADFDVDASLLKDFTPDNFYWDFGNGLRVKGKQATVRYKKRGKYKVKCGTIDAEDDSKMVCFWTMIEVK